MEDAKDIMVETKSMVLHPIGERIIGNKDPRTLGLEEFKRSPDLLYHGAAKPFSFRPNYDYSSAEYYTDADGSQTIGQGFYTADVAEAAGNYSVVRQLEETKSPVIMEILPYQARVLDLRAREDQTKNAPVHREFFEKWKKFYQSYHNSSERNNLPWYMVDLENGYLLYLQRVSKLPSIDLRVMLETTFNVEAKSRNLPSPPWTNLFSNFMKHEGYDGLVYIEGGEGKNRIEHASYVFFNQLKIGTYESWHDRTAVK